MTAGKTETEIAGYILAGGGSTRFGRDKALVEVGGKPMLERMIELLRGVTKQVKLVAAPGKYSAFGVETIEDQWPGEGPLGGIITALEDAAKSPANIEWNLIVSCDMPFLTADWVAFVCERATKSKAQVMLPCSASGPEPLCACWQTAAAAKLRSGFERSVRKVTEGIALLRAEVLDEADWKRFDNEGRLFWNMNTAADYAEAVRILEAERK
ncbi:MAG TPA: molybdenum cofactor guanylyltransferase [Candidatus Polarisedimenticolia bacterium]|nr:molybdenum cofactor guanylyltransferase [Candidatus Polarisedimenticolia bacterium]